MDKVFTWDASLKFQKFLKINKYLGTIIRRIKDGEFSYQSFFKFYRLATAPTD